MFGIGSINKDLLPIKVHYFLFNAGTGPIQPFLSTYARQLGFSSVIVGLIYTILPICGMIAKPVVGAIADRFRCQKLVFILAQLLTAIAFLSINFSPEIPKDRKVHFACDVYAAFDTSPINNIVDDCLIANFQKDSGTVRCQLECLMEPQFWKVIVDDWGATEYNGTNATHLSFTAIVNSSEKIGSNAYFRFGKVQMANGKTHNPVCPSGQESISTLCDIQCDNYDLNELVTQSAVSDHDVYAMSEFFIFVILMIFGWVGQAIAVSVGDAICFELLGDRPERYGYQRMFGSLGWGIFSALAGFMVDSLSSSSSKNFASAFYLSFAFLLLDVAVSSRIKNVQVTQSSNILKDVGRVIANFRIIVFLVWCVVMGMCTGLIWNFLFFLIEDLAKEQGCESQQWVKTLEGLQQAIQTLLGEMPFFFLSGRIFKRIGHVHSMTLVMMVMGIRYILYSVIANPWWFLPVELLNGLTFGLFYACMTSYASIVAPPGTEATVQGVVGAVFEGVGVSLGSFLGGLLYDQYGGPWTFRIFGIMALVVSLLHAAVQYLIQRLGKKGTDFEARYTTPAEALDPFFDDQQELTLID